MSLLLEALLAASEKAANVARRCRGDEHLFGLLVQRKGAGEGNPRFVEDFKTLADVLIQEAVKRDVALRVRGAGGGSESIGRRIVRESADQSVSCCIKTKE